MLHVVPLAHVYAVGLLTQVVVQVVLVNEPDDGQDATTV